MSLHTKKEYNTLEIIKALRDHGMEAFVPSQMSDAFRLGFVHARLRGEEPMFVSSRKKPC